MTDWSGHDGRATAKRYREMARFGLHAISPSYERICYGVAGDAAMLGQLDTLPPPKRQPNLLLAAVRFLGGPVSSYAEFRSFVMDRWDEVAAIITARRTQTNEARRCATLLPALAQLPQPLALLEVGASAGLCLQPDRYAYRYDQHPVLGTSSLVLQCATEGPVPLPAALPLVRWRAGLDLNPIDLTDEQDVRWLESLIWPEEVERFDILRQAIAIAREHPIDVRAGDLSSDLVALAAEAPADATLVVFHTAVLAYLTDNDRTAFREQLDEVGRRRPVIWLSNEAPGVVVSARVPNHGDDFVLARDGVVIGYANSHGNSVVWTNP